jgi:hypothetical protein
MNLTEECFQAHPLDFNREKQTLQWNNGTRYPINGTFVDVGTHPVGRLVLPHTHALGPHLSHQPFGSFRPTPATA